MKHTHEKRTQWLRNLMSNEGIDGFILPVRENFNWESCYYLSGFRGSSAALLISQKSQTLLTDARYTAQASAQSPYEVIDRGNVSLPEALASHMQRLGLKNVAMEGERVFHKMWLDIAQKSPNIAFFDKSHMIPKLRRAKDKEEIKIIRECSRIAGAAFLEALESVSVGMTELEFSNLLEHRLKLGGAEGGWGSNSFVVASGPRSALPHGAPTERKFTPSDWVTVDFGARYGGYVCDITRNFACVRVSPWALEIHKILLEAQSEAVAALAHGVTARLVDAAARDVIAGAGWEENFSHGLGHGIGLELHEAPRISFLSDDVIQSGDIVTIEPGIYAPGRGGLRLEDNYAVYENKVERLTSLPTELFCVG